MTARWFVRPVLYALLILCSLFFLMPVYVMLVTSLKPLSEVTLEKMWALPSTLDFS
ncbi:carbohydrate ABC transporter permease, partial [Bacillus pumilus]